MDYKIKHALKETFGWVFMALIVTGIIFAILQTDKRDRLQRKAILTQAFNEHANIVKIEFQKEAIKEGHASWITNTNGLPEFKWNDNCKIKMRDQ